MAQYKIIELNEQASTYKNGNGDYSVVVGPATTLETGDIVSLEKAFLDTSAQGSQKITIPQGGVTLDFTVGYYLNAVREFPSMDTTGMDNYAANPGLNQPYADGKTYVLCQAGAGGQDIRALSNFLVKYNQDKDGPEPSAPDPARPTAKGHIEFIWTIQFTDSNNRVQHGTISTWDFDWLIASDDGTTWQSSDIAKNINYNRTKPLRVINCVVGRTTFGGVNNQKLEFWTDNQNTQFTYTFNIAGTGQLCKFDGGFYVAPADQQNLAEANITPFTQNTETLGLSISIPQGQYTPTDLAQVVNDGLAKNYADPTIAGSILKSAFLLQYSKDTDPFQDTQFICIDREEDNSPIATFNILANNAYNGGILIGATQMELSYDEDRAQFFWAYIHTPYLSGPSPNVESVAIANQTGLAAAPAGPGNQKMLITRNSGIFFTSCRSKDVNGVEIGFWDQLLGWSDRTDTENKQPSFMTKLALPFTGNIKSVAVTNCFLPDSLEIGKFTTTGYYSLSSVQDLTAASPPGNWWHMPALGADEYAAQTNASVPIFSGHEDVTSNTTEVGYYLVEVSGVGGGNELQSGGMYLNRQIMGIVSGYFARDSFTTGTGSDSLSYIHRGLPISLEGFSVRILAPNKDVALNLGVNNSIMLRITKAAPQTPTP